MAIKAGFLIGGDTNETPQSLARKRALIAQIMASGRAPTTIGEGLNALGDGIVANVLGRRADAAEQAGIASANDAFSPIAAMLSGGYGANASPSASAPRPSSAPSPEGQPPIPGIQQSGPSSLGSSPDTAAVEGYIRQAASARGIDPDVAVKVARSEGLGPGIWQSNYVKDGRRETSYGPFQLLVGGGLGDKFQRLYGKSPADPSTVQQQVDFALDEAATGGWSPWYGAAKVGVGSRTGLDNARALGYQQTPAPTSAAEAVTAMGQGGQLPDQASAYVDPMVVTPNSRPQAMAPQQGPSSNGLPFDLVSGSPQLARADTRRGILRALTGQTGPEPGATGAFPAAPMSAPMVAPKAAPAPSTAAPALTQAAPATQQTQISTQQLIAAINNPWLNDSQRAIAQSMLEQQMQANDPVRQMQLEKSRLELEAMRNPKTEYDIISGKDGSIFRANKNAGTVEQVYGGKPDLPTDVQEYEYAKKQGFEGSFVDFQLAQKKAGASQVNIDQKAEGAFDKKLAEKQAESLDTMATEGMNAKADLAVIGELGTLMQGRGGTLDGISGALAKYGIGGDGVGDIQAAQALINRLVPTQRQPGSGSMSDRDVELFTRSLPSLWNQPGGNERILSAMRGLAQYKQAQGDIAQRVMTGELSRQDATKMLRDLPNPLAGFKPEQGTVQPPEGVDPEIWNEMTPEEKALWK